MPCPASLEPPHDAVARSALELAWDEDLRWSLPYYTFSLERHGATVNGSSRAEVHHWSVNVEAETTRQTTTGRRKRFYEALDELLQPKWTRTGTGRWMKYVRTTK